MIGREIYYAQAGGPLTPPMPDLRAVAEAIYADVPGSGELAVPLRLSEIPAGICARRYAMMSPAIEAEMRSMEGAGLVVRRVPGDAGTGRLSGARVLVTRPQEQAVRLSALLRLQGSNAVSLPAIRFAAASDPTALQAAVRGAEGADYLIFTSANGVRFFFGAFSAEGRKVGSLQSLRVYAVGTATATELRSQGLMPEGIPVHESARGLAELLIERVPPKAVGLLFGPEPGVADLVHSLREGGLHVQAVAAYRTVQGADPADAAAVQVEGPLDAALFYSPSAVQGTLQALPRAYLLSARIVAVGPTTAAALRAAELPPDGIAAVPSDHAVVEALCELWHDAHREEG
jgi:uroporphyrinogen-III synthase